MCIYIFFFFYFLKFICNYMFTQNGAISVPDTVEDDDEGSEGAPSEDMESAPPPKKKASEAVKFGWIRGVLVSYFGSCQSL